MVNGWHHMSPLVMPTGGLLRITVDILPRGVNIFDVQVVAKRKPLRLVSKAPLAAMFPGLYRGTRSYSVLFVVEGGALSLDRFIAFPKREGWGPPLGRPPGHGCCNCEL
jgi:hypothetical protein